MSPQVSEQITPAPPPGTSAGGGQPGGAGTSSERPEAFEGFLQWQKSNRVRCIRIGLSPMEIAVVEVLAGLPEKEPRGDEWIKTPGSVWVPGTRMALWLYGSETPSQVRESSRLLKSMEARGYIRGTKAWNHRSKRYNVERLRAWMASVDVTDIWKTAAPPVPLPAGCPPAPKQRAPKKVAPPPACGDRKRHARMLKERGHCPHCNLAERTLQAA